MPKVSVFDMAGKEVSQMELSEAVFGIKPNTAVMNLSLIHIFAGIEETLTRRMGISENLNTPPEGQSRLPLAANIRHALYLSLIHI